MAASITVDELVVLINAQTDNFKKEIAKINSELDGVSKQAAKSTSTMEQAFSKVGKAATIALKVGVVGAIAAITASIPSAVKRIDTLNNAPKILKNLGYAANDSEAAMTKLDLGIRGLPTSLDEATNSLVAIASASGKSIDEATNLTLAFNNMALAGGKGPAEAQRAFVQFTQAVGRGKMGMQEFQTLSEVMPAQLSQVAKGLLGPTANAQTLRDAMSDGAVTMEQFMDEIVRLDKNGGKGFSSFSVQAKDATAGIATGFANMRIGITRGVAAILAAIGAANITEVLGSIGRAFGTVLGSVAGLINFVADHSDIFAPLAISVATAAAAILAYNTYIKLSAVLTALWSAASTYMSLVASLQAQGLGLLRAAWLALNITMAANPIGLVIVAVAALTAGLVWFFTQTETGREIFKKAMEAIKNAAKAVWDWINTNWPLLLAILIGPIGIAVKVISSNTDAIKNAFSNAWNAIKGVWSAAKGFFNGVASGIKGAFNAIPGWLKSIFSGAFDGIKSAASSMVGWFRGVPGSIGQAMSSVTDKILAPFKSAFNGIASAWNNTVAKISFKAPDWVPGMGGKGFSVPKIPMLAQGGIVTAPTLAMIGEGGQSEAVIPLDKLDKMTGNQHLVINIGGDKVVDTVVKGINNRSFMGNTTVLDF